MLIEIFQPIISWYMESINYFTIFLLMAVESSFIPFPSEIIIPPAAYKAAQGSLNIYLVGVSGSLGALFGAFFNYYFALFLGRKIIYSFAETRFAKMMMVDRKGVDKAEAYFIKNGKMSTLIGRLVPGIRQLISLPAGLARMNIKDFALYTIIGSTIWNIILMLLGFYLYTQKDLLDKYYYELSYTFLGAGLLFVVYLIYKGLKK